MSACVADMPAVSQEIRSRAPKAFDMNLQELLIGAEIGKVTGPFDAEIRSIFYDSRKVTPGAIFFAFRGQKLKGIEFVSDALGRGAIAVASEDARPVGIPEEITWVELLPGSERRSLARAAANFYGHPADALQLAGVTGTNGKTTTTFLVDSILRAAGFTSALIGTTGYRTPQGSRKAVNTTPESLDLQQMFAEVRDAGGTHAVLEVS
ncbi:MAG: Mur ligase family protein, partial [Candidatus Acidiferrales bacterium]